MREGDWNDYTDEDAEQSKNPYLVFIEMLVRWDENC